MSKERMEDKLVKFRQHLALGYVNMDILNQAHEIHELVIEQAERVQNLESRLAFEQGVTSNLQSKNKRYHEAIEKAIGGCRYTNPEVAYILGQALEGEE